MKTRTLWKEAWRVDAHADENGVGVGGWWPRTNKKGQVETGISPWFAIKVTPENAPWAFQREGRVYRVIASLEALLCLLLALLAFGPAQELSDTKTVIQVNAFTDNRGNGYVINKLMFPLCAIVMELAAQAEYRGVRMEAQWTEPRSGRPIEPPDGRLRSRERGEGGLRGSKLVRNAPAAETRREVLGQEEEKGREVKFQGEMVGVRGGSGMGKEQGEERDRRNRQCAELGVVKERREILHVAAIFAFAETAQFSSPVPV